jgi:hypothetical protein
MTPNPEPEFARLVTRTLHLALTSDAESFDLTVRARDGIVVCLDRPGPEYRTRVADFVSQSIEAELERLGASTPGYGPEDALSDKLSDQLYRARLLGNGGLGLRFANLDGLSDESGQLGLEDSHALRVLFEIAQRDRLQLYLPESASALRVVGAPEPLCDWLSAGSRAGRVASIEYEPLESPSPPATEWNDKVADVTNSGADGLSSLPPLAAFAEPAEELPTEAPVSTEQPRDAMAIADIADAERASPSSEPELRDGMAQAAQRSETRDVSLERRCESWAAQLQNMNGPKVHGSIERAFLTAYLPLCREVAAGNAPGETRVAVESWAEGFAQSYATAFKSLGSRPKRPKMVKDIIDIGTRWLSQHRARQCQLLVVDGLRFDLGQRLNEEIERRLGGRATCADQTLLWAALPSNAESQQIGEQRLPRATLFGKHQGRSEAVESVRVGSRELFRVDAIGADLGQSGEVEPRRLNRLALALADSIVPWLREQPADTLVVLFGDHGFHWQANENGTSAAKCGGALPEQVLVPASAWLLGDPRAKAALAAGLH